MRSRNLPVSASPALGLEVRTATPCVGIGDPISSPHVCVVSVLLSEPYLWHLPCFVFKENILVINKNFKIVAVKKCKKGKSGNNKQVVNERERERKCTHLEVHSENWLFIMLLFLN